ncbi:MAG: NfeD family protein [Candidatus Ventricola sp.]
MFENLMANLPILLCLVLGAALMIVEVFLPGFGLPGVSGIVLIGSGVAIIWLKAGALTALATLLVIIAVLAVFISYVMRRATDGGAHARIFLREKEELRGQEDMQVLLGKQGRTTSVLRPAGIGDFDGVRLNVVTEGSFIERDKPIEIVNVDGARIVVRERKSA